MKGNFCLLRFPVLLLGLFVGSQTVADTHHHQAKTNQGINDGEHATQDINNQKKNNPYNALGTDQLFSQGINAFDASDHSKASIKYNEGLDLASRSNNRRTIGRYLDRIGEVSRSIGQN